jgi:hypothetical protein
LELEPHVVLALHMLPGFCSEHRYFLLLLPPRASLNPLAETYPPTNITQNANKQLQIAALRRIFMSHLEEK